MISASLPSPTSVSADPGDVHPPITGLARAYATGLSATATVITAHLLASALMPSASNREDDWSDYLTRAHGDAAGVQDRSVEAEFARLAEQWREETEDLSSIMRIVMHPAYQRIIGMGPAAVPLILQDLARTESHWFWALQSITGENPIAPSARGYVPRMAEAWLDWGRQRGIAV